MTLLTAPLPSSLPIFPFFSSYLHIHTQTVFKDFVEFIKQATDVMERFECQNKPPCFFAELKEEISKIHNNWKKTYYKLKDFCKYFIEYAEDIEDDDQDEFKYDDEDILDLTSEWRQVKQVADIDTFSELYDCGFWCKTHCSVVTVSRVGTNWIDCNPMNTIPLRK